MIIISGLINCQLLDDKDRSSSENPWVTITNVVTVFLLCESFILPVVTVCYIWPSYYRLQEPAIANFCSSLYGMVGTGESIAIEQAGEGLKQAESDVVVI